MNWDEIVKILLCVGVGYLVIKFLAELLEKVKSSIFRREQIPLEIQSLRDEFNLNQAALEKDIERQNNEITKLCAETERLASASVLASEKSNELIESMEQTAAQLIDMHRGLIEKIEMLDRYTTSPTIANIAELTSAARSDLKVIDEFSKKLSEQLAVKAQERKAQENTTLKSKPSIKRSHKRVDENDMEPEI